MIRDVLKRGDAPPGECCRQAYSPEEEAELRDRFEGDAGVILAVLEGVIEDSAGHLSRMRAAIERADAHGLEFSAHSIRGLLAYAGARRAIALAGVLEHQAEAGILLDATDGVRRLEEELDRLLPELRVLRAGLRRAA